VLARLRAIGPHPALLARYIWHYGSSRVRNKWFAASYPRTIARPPQGATLLLPEIDLPFAADLPAELILAAERIRAEAELVIDHRVDYLGSGLFVLGPQIDWHRDFKSGYRWPAAFYQQVEVTRLTDASDAKVPWELSRGHQLLTLARAARMFGDERYSTELEAQLASWLDANPTGVGINWANPMEVAIRAVNWIWALATLGRPLEKSLQDRVVRSLQSHGRHVAANLEGTPYLRSNHYLGDVLGLLVLGVCLQSDPAATRWLRDARSALEREIMSQVHDDGTGFEASLPYHGLALEMFLIARASLAWAGHAFSGQYDMRLLAMLEATRALRHPNGRLPQFGDADSGRILPGGFERLPTADHLLWLGAALLGSAPPTDGEPHDEVAWTLGLQAWQAARRLPNMATPSRTDFKDGGLYTLRSPDLHVVVRCGDVGQNGNGGHSHNDLLSFELSSRQVPIVVDPGTYAYTGDPDARNAFRGTRAHSTVAVAGAEINPIDPERIFELAQFARPVVYEVEHSSEGSRLVVGHDGYRRLTPPVEHRRTFILDRVAGAFSVSDELRGFGTQQAESYLHLAAGTQVRSVDDLTFAFSHAGTTLMLACWGAAAVEVIEGWVSDRFGVRERAPVLVLRCQGDLPLAFGYRFYPPEKS
jgi:hypothetical protein